MRACEIEVRVEVGRVLFRSLGVDRVAHVGVAARDRPGAVVIVGDGADRAAAVAPGDAGRVVGRVLVGARRWVARIGEGRHRAANRGRAFRRREREPARGHHVRIGDGGRVGDHLWRGGIVADGHADRGRALALGVDRVAHVGVAARDRPGAVVIVVGRAHLCTPVAPEDPMPVFACELDGARRWVARMGEVRDLLSFFFNDTATTEIYTLSLHDALPIYGGRVGDHLWRGGIVADGHADRGRALALGVDRVAHVGVAARHRPGAVVIVIGRASRRERV